MPDPDGAPPLRVLVVDDDPAARRALREALSRAPAMMIAAEAATGAAGVSAADDADPDVVVIDADMPEVDGVEATRRLHELAPELPIVAISGHDYEERVLEIRDAGASDYVRKSRVEEDLPAALLALVRVRG